MTDRQALKSWEETIKNIRKLKVVKFESPVDKEERIKRLKGDWIAFSKHYFPEYASSEFAPFHKKIAKALINVEDNENNAIYAVCMLAREHGKTALIMFLLFYLKEVGKIHNILYISASFDAAVDLVMPLVLNLEHNQRIINDYGDQKSLGSWEEGKWITNDGFGIRAIGAGQSPRGTREGEKRPDVLVFDDIDTDKEVKNPTQIKKKFDWIEQAAIPAMSLVETKRIIFLGNKIGKVTCITKAWEKADFKIKVNILNSKGQPSWNRYTLKQIQYMLDKISYSSGQKEYFNNPITEGLVFKDLTYGKVPRLNSFKFLVIYCDPSYKSSKKSDFKAVTLLGMKDGVLYIIAARLEQTTVAKMIQWFYDFDDLVNGKTSLYMYVEAGSLQDTFFTELFLPRLSDAGNARGKHLPIAPDHRSKPDKFTRIEAALEPLNRTNRLVFNEKYQTDPHMQRLVEQFEILEPSLSGGHDDGPDSVEGGHWIINNKLRVFSVKAGATRRSSKKY